MTLLTYFHFIIVKFQLTRSRGAWLAGKEVEYLVGNFNSHAHVERDVLFPDYLKTIQQISTHTLTWSVTEWHVPQWPCEAISTHTLTWSVTRSICNFCKILYISTHTLTWSVTFVSLIKLSDLSNFNSHAHVERDHFGRCKNCKYFHFNSHAHVERDMCGTNFGSGAKISTHTLTWSVTSQFFHMLQAYFNFNSHAHVERDNSNLQTVTTHTNFNSHAHVERDPLKFFCHAYKLPISTHTLTWSVTDKSYLYFLPRIISTHTLTWSVTIILAEFHHVCTISTHTLTWSVTYQI